METGSGLYFNSVRLSQLFIALFIVQLGCAQWVKSDDTTKIWMNDGVYMSEIEFLNNSPSLKWVQTVPAQWRFVDSLERKGVVVGLHLNATYRKDIQVSQRRFLVHRNDSQKIIDRRDVWGICVHGDAYMYVDRDTRENFKRIDVNGIISYLTFQTIYEDPFDWSPDVMASESGYRNEIVDLVIDFEDKKISRNSKSELEKIIQRDTSLYQQYLTEKKKSKAIYRYVVRFNDRYPLQFKPDDVFELDKQ
ncbi:MAG: hypothetical protein ACPGEG_06790 [Salibacteraceae bacterium]